MSTPTAADRREQAKFDRMLRQTTRLIAVGVAAVAAAEALHHIRTDSAPTTEAGVTAPATKEHPRAEN